MVYTVYQYTHFLKNRGREIIILKISLIVRNVTLIFWNILESVAIIEGEELVQLLGICSVETEHN